MNWLADVGNALLGVEAAPPAGKEGPDAVEAPDAITVYAGGSSDGSEPSSVAGEEDAAAAAAAAEHELAALGDLHLGSGDQEGLMDEVRKILFQPSKIGRYIGMDVTSLMSVPLFIMEPFSMLQKMAEIMEYHELLDAADAADDPYERLALVAAFLVSPFGAAERTWKPFNPVLGETFEADALGRGVTFVAEQVSHHPPVSAAHAENERWAYDIVSAPTTKFLGNSLEVYPKGRTRITLRRTGETYSHVPPNAKVHNLVLGKTWVDSFGPFSVVNTASGARVALEFRACGWFGAGQHEFDGHVLDEQGNARFAMTGKWNSHVDLAPCAEDGTPAPDAEPRRLWTCAAKPEDDAFGCTHFAWRLNSCELLDNPPLPTDSRRRPDRLALQQRQLSAAAAEKGLIEEEQRLEKRLREERSEQWAAKWFEPAPDMQVLPGEADADTVPLWRWKGAWGSRQAPPAVDGWQDEVCGKGFMPWQFRSRPLERSGSSRSSSRSPTRGSRSPTRKPKAASTEPAA